jgi:hypothetical protein
MLSLNECKQLIDDSTLSDEEILRIRDACYELADIALEHIESLRKGAIPQTEPADNMATPNGYPHNQ